MKDIAIVSAVRTPIGSFRGAFAPFPLSTSALRRCVAYWNVLNCRPMQSTS